MDKEPQGWDEPAGREQGALFHPGGLGEERCQLICVHTGSSPGNFLPTRDFAGDALEERRCPEHPAEPPTATHWDRGAHLSEDAFVIAQGSITFI